MQDNLQKRIKQRILSYHELTEKQANNYAWLALHEMRKWILDVLVNEMDVSIQKATDAIAKAKGEAL